jgi:hypothetical protein
MNLDKPALFTAGVKLAERFCRANGLVMPMVVSADATWKFPKTCAFYRRGTIHVSIRRCAAVGRGGRSWSWPGYAVDRTPYGVIQHELGHHIDCLFTGKNFGRAPKAYGSWAFSARTLATSGEAPLTGYAPNAAEWFAEHFKLFVTNPDLLQWTRPRTYAALRAILQPVVTMPWRATLAEAEAPIRIQAAALSRIGKAAA